MPLSGSYDSVIVGSGPNGLAAAITLASAGKSVRVFEAGPVPGGCLKTDEGTLPGFLHDTCAAVFPMAVGTPFFESLPSHAFPVEWIVPPAALAHPFDDGSCLLLSGSLEQTMEALGDDGGTYGKYIGPFASQWRELASELLNPVFHIPRHIVSLLQFGIKGIWPVSLTARHVFRTDKARALFAGLGAHSIMPLEHPLTSAFALVMGASAHATGWPIPRGGAGSTADALVSHLKSLGAEITLSHPVGCLDELPRCGTVFFDVSPKEILRIARSRIPKLKTLQLERYRYGPGAFKLDWALSGPIPWEASGCSRAATVHVGGSYEEIALAEREVRQGVHPRRPFVLCAQPSLFDRTRAPEGKHTAWAYCHVPNGSQQDMTERIEAQIERFAPGFRKKILARRVLSPSGLEKLNANLVGGDIAGGVNSLFRILFRPFVSAYPYSLGDGGLYICSSSSPPGGGVHGMCGYNAALSALKKGR